MDRPEVTWGRPEDICAVSIALIVDISESVGTPVPRLSLLETVPEAVTPGTVVNEPEAELTWLPFELDSRPALGDENASPPESVPVFELVIVGNGPLSSALVALSKTLDELGATILTAATTFPVGMK